jgi:ELWxxDGT repeat protein
MKTSFWRGWRPSARAGKPARPLSRGRRRLIEVEQLEYRTLLSGTPQLVADITPVAAPSMVVIGSEAYFTANDGTHGNELWKTDGTTAGTVMVADINPGSAGSYPGNLTNVNGELFFSATDGTHGYQLWKSDGTAAGTTMFADINRQPQNEELKYLTNVNGTLFFSNAGNLWKSDGTAAGTAGVSGAVTSTQDLANVNGELYFSGAGGDGLQLWKSDGTAAGTVEVKDIYPGIYTGYYDYGLPRNSSPRYLTNVNGTLFFAATDANGKELWKSDGTAAGTVSLNSVEPDDLTNVNNTLYFSTGEQLCKSDGTAAGTVEVAGFPGGRIRYLTNVNGELFFAANDGTHGTELWKSNGTAAGSVMVADIVPGSYGSYPYDLTNVNGEVYFAADDGTHGNELWKSDGTAAGTVLVADIDPGSGSSGPSNLTNLNGTLLFAAYDGTGRELWEVPASPSLAVSAASDTPTAGQADTFTITALNADGTPDTTLNGAVSISVSDARASGPASVTLTNGTAQFNVTFETAGPQAVTATDVQTPSDQGADGDIVVQPAAASQLTFIQQPTTTTAGKAISPAVTVTVEDPYGNVVTSDSSTVTLTLSSGTFSGGSATASTAASGGVASFSSLTIDTPGSYSLQATDGNLTSVTSSTFTVEPAASTLNVTGFPSPTTAGVAGSFTVTARDSHGNIVTAYTGTVSFTSSDGQAGLPASYTFTTADQGVHTFSATLKTAGTQSITATDTATSSVTGSDTGITVNPAAASSLSITGLPATVTAGKASTFTITALDPYGNTATGYRGTVHFTSSDKKASLPANYTFKASDNGLHTFTNGVKFKTTGTQTLTATDTVTSTITGTVTVTVSSASGSVLVAAPLTQAPTAAASGSSPPTSSGASAPPDGSTDIGQANGRSSGAALPLSAATLDAFFSGAPASGDGDSPDLVQTEAPWWLR